MIENISPKHESLAATSREESVIKPDGRKSEILISKEEKIGQGAGGEISRVKVSISDEEKLREIRQSFIIKEFRDNKINGDKKLGTEHSLKIYQQLKNLGIKTWKTYRQLEGKDSILITDGGGDDNFIVSTSDRSSDKNYLLKNRYEIINHFSEAISSAIEDVLKAGNNNLYIPGDAWFDSFKDSKEKENFFSKFKKIKKCGELTDVFIGDFDSVRLMEPQNQNDEKLLLKNLSELESHLENSLLQFGPRENLKHYRKIYQKQINAIANKLDDQIWKSMHPENKRNDNFQDSNKVKWFE
ncbi:MAG: hypothetical protein ACOYMB_04280 [Patescibacteria group bacterium]